MDILAQVSMVCANSFIYLLGLHACPVHCRHNTSHQNQHEAGATVPDQHRSEQTPGHNQQHTQCFVENIVLAAEDLLRHTVEACMQSRRLPHLSNVQVEFHN